MVGRGSRPMVHGTLLTNTCFVGVSPWDICWCVKSFRSGRVECGGSGLTADGTWNPAHKHVFCRSVSMGYMLVREVLQVGQG